jgi:glycosyltransferase involved in cell wall biosynthesis
MQPSPTVSVVMSAYNMADYIADSVESVLAQTFSDFELIIVDDGSADATREVAGRFRDPRIRVIAAPHRGMPFPLCEGIDLAQAPYLALLDSDDSWSPRNLERQVGFLQEHPEVDVTFSWSRVIDEHGQDTGLTSRQWRGPISFSQLLADNVIGNGSALVFRRQAFLDAGGFDTSLSYCYDVDAWLRIALLRPGNVYAVPEFLTFYRRRVGQMSSDVSRLENGFERMVEKLRPLAPDQVARVQKQARSNMQRFFALRRYQAGYYGESLRRLGRSFAAAPAEFLAETRNWKMAAAATAGLILPSSWHDFLVRAALKATGA